MLQLLTDNRLKIALFIALLFHISGAIGIVATPYTTWFTNNTPLNLVLMAVLTVWLHRPKQTYFYWFGVIAFIVGMLTEMIGVNTGLLFGHYHYGQNLGIRIAGVPLVIGLNWWITTYISGVIIGLAYQKTETIATPSFTTSNYWEWSKIVDGALLATFFDYIMEPGAQKLGFWQWENGEIPLYNYVCWFVISLFLQWIFVRFKCFTANYFALHLFIIQSLFFITIRLFL